MNYGPYMPMQFGYQNQSKDFSQVQDKIAQRNGIILDDVRFIEPLLDSRYERQCVSDTYVGEFAEDYPYGIYLITMNGHITCCIDGVIYDTFDCRDRVMWCAWRVD